MPYRTSAPWSAAAPASARGHGVHTAVGEEDPGDRVHVGDHGVDREGVAWREPGVHGLEGEQPPQALVGEVGADLGRESPQPAHGQQPCARTVDQGQGGVQIAVDEVLELDGIQPVQEAHQIEIARRVAGRDRVPDLLRHAVRVGVQIDDRSVGEVGAIGRLEPAEGQTVGQALPDAGQRIVDQIGHRENRRTAVEGVPVAVDHPGSTAWLGGAFEQCHPPSGTEQSQCGRQATEAGADHDDVLGRPGYPSEFGVHLVSIVETAVPSVGRSTAMLERLEAESPAAGPSAARSRLIVTVTRGAEGIPAVSVTDGDRAPTGDCHSRPADVTALLAARREQDVRGERGQRCHYAGGYCEPFNSRARCAAFAAAVFVVPSTLSRAGSRSL